MTARDRTITKLNRIISMLGHPLCAGDVDAGWDEQSRSAWHGIFSKLRDHIRRGEPLHPKYSAFFVAVGLDGWGIHHGRLCRLADEIGEDLCDTVRDEAIARGEDPDADKSDVPADPERMKWIDELLTREWGPSARENDDSLAGGGI